MILLGIIAAALVFYYYWSRRKWLWYASKMKGIRGFPVIGSAYKFLNTGKIMQVFEDFGGTYGSPAKFWLGPRLFVFTKDPSHAEIVLNNENSMDKGDSYDFMVDAAGNGLITLKAEGWRFHRKHLNPSFGPSVVNSFIPIFNKNLSIFIDRLRHKHGQGPFDVAAYIKPCSLDMVSETTFGIKMEIQRSKDPELLHAAHNLLSVIGKRFFQPWIQPQLLFRISKHFKVFYDSRDIIDRTVTKILAIKKKEYLENRDDGLKSTHSNIFISQILKLSINDRIFNDDDVISELKTILLAGYETTATAVMNAFTLLAMHPDMQQKLYQEIRDIAPADDVTLEQMSQMKYLDAFISETMRFTPVVPFLTRLIKKDIKFDDVVIPEGAEVIIDMWGMHRDKSNWMFDATQFNPENFFKENEVPRPKYSYLPFSAGPRVCIGKKYGIISMKLFLIHTVRSFKLSTRLKMKDLKFQMQVTYAISNKDVIELHLRDEIEELSN